MDQELDAVDAGEYRPDNAALERAELTRWAERPDRQLAYYHFPKPTGDGLTYLADFRPHLEGATVTTWPGTVLGTITAAHVFPHNFGARMIALTIQGTNGARYTGRASFDGGSCVWLRRAKS